MKNFNKQINIYKELVKTNQNNIEEIEKNIRKRQEKMKDEEDLDFLKLSQNKINDYIKEKEQYLENIELYNIEIKKEQKEVKKEIIDKLNIFSKNLNSYLLKKEFLNECILNNDNILLEIEDFLSLINEENDLNKIQNSINSITSESDKIKFDFNEEYFEESHINEISLDISTKNVNEYITNNEKYILDPKKCEYGIYSLKKSTHSLKNFFTDNKMNIIKVFNEFNDLNKTLTYLKLKHGLCPGETIKQERFNFLFNEYCQNTQNKRKLKVEYGNIEIYENTGISTLLKTLKLIGFENIINNCKSLFNNRFNISKSKFTPNYGILYEVLDNVGLDKNIYYIHAHFSNEEKLELLNDIKNLLKLNSLKVSYI